MITLKNGHYSYKNPTISKQLRGATNVKDKLIIMYEGVPTEDGNVQHWAHDGKKRYEVDREVLNAFRIKPYGCKYIYRATAKARGKQVLSLEEQYDNYIEDTDELFEKSGGLINLRRQLFETASSPCHIRNKLYKLGRSRKGFLRGTGSDKWNLACDSAL